MKKFSAKNSFPQTFVCTASNESSTLTCVAVNKPQVLAEHSLSQVKTGNDQRRCARAANTGPDQIVTITVDLAQWDPVNLVRTSLNKPFDVKLRVRRSGTLVTILIPAIQFDLSVGGVPVPGFLYTVPGTNLPRELWPAQLLGQSFVVPDQHDGLDYSLTVGPDGALTWGAPDAGIISPMPANDGHRLAPTTVSYLLPICTLQPPTNVKLSFGSSNVVGNTSRSNDYLDYYANDIRQGPALVNGVVQNASTIRAAFCWASNSTGAAPPRNFIDLYIRTATVNPVTGIAAYGPPVQLSRASLNQYFFEASVSVNPTNVNNIVAITNLYDYNFPRHKPGYYRPMAFSSMDGGLTWTETQPYTNDELAVDAFLTFDTYGNCFISALTADPPGNYNNVHALNIKVSSDGGKTFPVQVGYIVSSDIPGAGFLDFAKMSSGPDGSGIPGKLALWFCGDDANFTLNTILPTIGFIPVTGLITGPGVNYGLAVVVNSFTNIPTGPGGIGQSEIFVNPGTGAVYFCSSNLNDFSGATNTLSDAALDSLWVNPTGTVGYNGNSFLPRRDIMISNLNDNVGGGGHTEPWTPNKGSINRGTRCFGFDLKRNRLYFCGNDMRPNLSYHNVILIAYSDNEGETWSNQYIINDVQTVSAGMPSISVEQNTGILATSWYDPRNDPVKQQFVDYYGAIFKAPEIC
jgi:hypothetical protein